MKYLMVKYSLAAFRAIRRGDGSAILGLAMLRCLKDLLPSFSLKFFV